MGEEKVAEGTLTLYIIMRLSTREEKGDEKKETQNGTF